MVPAAEMRGRRLSRSGLEMGGAMSNHQIREAIESAKKYFPSLHEDPSCLGQEDLAAVSGRGDSIFGQVAGLPENAPYRALRR